MRVLQGIAVSPGVAIGEALIFDDEGFGIPRPFVARDGVESQIERLDQAMDRVECEITHDREEVSRELGDHYGAIFSAHLQMLRDPKLRQEVEQLMRDQGYSPEYAVSSTLRRYAQALQQLDSHYLSERSHDILDIERSLLRHLLGVDRLQLSQLSSPVVVLAHNLTPSETARLDAQFVLGFATEIGGASSHTAIVAKGMNIPAVVGISKFLHSISGGETVIVDGNLGRLILQPDEKTIDRYRREAREHETLSVRLEEIRDLPAETCDGVRISLHANIEFPHEVDACLAHGADGIGLYRTEFLYLGVTNEPSEEEQFEAYAQVVHSMQGRPVVIRTLDLGADKLGQLPRSEEEQNPCLGLRSIRLSLHNVATFRTQLRAVLRASTLGDVRLMFPLITTLPELREARKMVADVMEDLKQQGVPFNPQIQIGMMVEVPAAVMMLDRFISEVDFISIGTNDLTQYTLAVDRGNRDVADLFRASDPAVLRLIQRCVDVAKQFDVPCSVCGEMGGTPGYVLVLLGLGLRSVSVVPSSVPQIKKICRSVTIARCEQLAQHALAMDNAVEIDAYLQKELKEVAPELVPH